MSDTVTTPIADPAQVGPSQGPSHQGSEAESRALKAEADLAALREGIKKKRETDAKALKEEESAAALKRGEHERVIKETSAELKAANARLDAIKEATLARINAAVDKMDDKSKAEINLVKDSLPIEKLEEYVALKWAVAQPLKPGAPPSPSPTSGAKGPAAPDDPVMKEARAFIDDLGGSASTVAMSEMMKAFPVGDGKEKYRFMGTGDDDKDTKSFIKLMRKIGHDPWQELHERQASRLKELEKELAAI